MWSSIVLSFKSQGLQRPFSIEYRMDRKRRYVHALGPYGLDVINSNASTSWRARAGSSCDFCAQRPPPDQNSDSFHAAPSAGIRIASRKRPAVRLSICDFKRSVSLSAASSHASHPQVGKAAVHQRPKRTRTPGKAENATTMGAAPTSLGTRVTLGRASL